ncbi:MAG: type I-D CRISPR-associated protein Cas7/Csc2 [Caldilineaceae bacterium]|nr:type I-D CRISPR-associated protein Cas7/Csc2 [Caldilineaceae bacterium]
MNVLKSELFPTQVPPKPSGNYAHIIMLRLTESYPLFQTDGELNTARVSAGAANGEIITRLTMFKRKQTTPERLTGRELLRKYGLISPESVAQGDKRETDANGLPIDEYNVSFCQWTPDAIAYGYAIGDSGSERSKVLSDTCYSITAYDDSHEAFTLNAPYESGTMSQRGSVTSRINEQDHVQPQVIFPSVLTTRDLTAPLFTYVLNNVLRTRRYGAQTTRTGRVENHLVAIVLADGEIFSNLKFTQCLYDCLLAEDAIKSPDPIDSHVALRAAQGLIPDLLKNDGVAINQLLIGDELQNLINELRVTTADEAGMKALLEGAFNSSQAYHEAWLAPASKSSKKK